jgi:hypothetical protein
MSSVWHINYRTVLLSNRCFVSATTTPLGYACGNRFRDQPTTLLVAQGYGCLRRRVVYVGIRSPGTLFYISVILWGSMGHTNNTLERKS